MIFDPQDSSTAYLVSFSGVYRSTDGGSTWEARNDGLPGYPSYPSHEAPTVISLRALAVDPESPSTLYAAISTAPFHDIQGGVYRSTDAGATWAPASDGLPLPLSVEALAIDLADPETVYAGTPKGVFRSLDGGGRWAPTPGNLPTPTTSVAIDPRTPARLFAGTGDQRSTRGTRRWCSPPS